MLTSETIFLENKLIGNERATLN